MKKEFLAYDNDEESGYINMSSYDKKSLAFEMTAVCGISCANCECHTAKDSPPLLDYLVGVGIPAEKLPCMGCRSLKGNCPVLGETCATYVCAHKRGVEFCFECVDFPCEKLNPAADRANVLPHNLKVYNLCTIKNRGLAKFSEEAGMVKQKYFKGKMLVGKGPEIEE